MAAGFSMAAVSRQQHVRARRSAADTLHSVRFSGARLAVCKYRSVKAVEHLARCVTNARKDISLARV
eukprot:CAMPEP_0179940964 /NCGR_PEP_ID=MMETSP0983-20121128/16655_1 /TAXON_ID=483367 /ORGANISM="non described non described, Strain CCMP 2436" /LENGTH=66 /DNA_ID=CAMNT_0021847817 /DNA_START=6 /DNA_END=206 /DNA_ORIENTATION=+